MNDTPTNLVRLIQPAYLKTCKVVESCETLEQYESSLRMVNLFYSFLNSSINRFANRRKGSIWVLKSYYTSNLNQLVQSTSRKFS